LIALDRPKEFPSDKPKTINPTRNTTIRVIDSKQSRIPAQLYDFSERKAPKSTKLKGERRLKRATKRMANLRYTNATERRRTKPLLNPRRSKQGRKDSNFDIIADD
jgi:hypothetical protein